MEELHKGIVFSKEFAPRFEKVKAEMLIQTDCKVRKCDVQKLFEDFRLVDSFDCTAIHIHKLGLCRSMQTIIEHLKLN